MPPHSFWERPWDPEKQPGHFRGVGDNLSVGDNLINASEHELGAGKSSDFSRLDPQF
jgi:hypothetical protein